LNLLKGTDDNCSVKDLFDFSARAVRRLERHALAVGRCVDAIRAITLAPQTSELRTSVITMFRDVEKTFRDEGLDQLLAALREIEKIVEGPRRG
jgi:hypothetical protein